jgi:hypothetical protein
LIGQIRLNVSRLEVLASPTVTQGTTPSLNSNAGRGVERIRAELGIEEFSGATCEISTEIPIRVEADDGVQTIFLDEGILWASSVNPLGNETHLVDFVFSQSQRKPNQADAFPNEAAARESMAVSTYYHRYICTDSDIAIFRIPSKSNDDDYIVLVNVRERPSAQQGIDVAQRTDDVNAELEDTPERVWVYRGSGEGLPGGEWGETRFYGLKYPIIAENQWKEKQSSALSEDLRAILNDPAVDSGVRENSFAMFNPVTSQLILHSWPEILSAFETRLEALDVAPRRFTFEAKVISAPDFDPSALLLANRDPRAERLLGDADMLGTTPKFDMLIEQLGDVELLSAPRMTQLEAKWPRYKMFLRNPGPGGGIGGIDSGRARGVGDLSAELMENFELDRIPGAFIADVRTEYLSFADQTAASENDQVQTTPLFQGLAFATSVLANEDGSFDVRFHMRDARLRPDAPDIYPDEAAAKDALDVRVFGYRYTCRDGETAMFRLPGEGDRDDVLIFVTVDEIDPT